MVSYYGIQQSIKKIEFASSHEDQLIKILEVYLDNFPVLNAYMLRYSPLGFLAEGMIYLTSEGGGHFGEARDDVRNFPIIYSAIRNKEAKYCTGLEYLKQMNSKYSFTSSPSTKFIVVPIFDGPIVYSYICTSELKEGTIVDEQMISALTLYGKLTGNVINNSNTENRNQLLSKRELEVMKRIAAGENSKEMSDYMGISILTINQYVKTAIKKLGAKNRAHAIGELFKRGIIS